MPETSSLMIDIVETKEGLLALKNDMQILFPEAFGREMEDREWEHYYLNCPYGNAIAFTSYSEDKLVAHGGLIPQRLQGEDGGCIDYYLQTAIMVHKDYQSLVLFNELMQQMQNYVFEKNMFSVAFPNHNTFLPFTRMLGWVMVREYNLVRYVVGEAEEINESHLSNDVWSYSVSKSEAFLSWRGELNAMQCYKEKSFTVYFKNFDGSCEILDVVGNDVPFKEIAIKHNFNTMTIPEYCLTQGSLSGLRYSSTVGIPQRMCFYPGEFSSIDYSKIQPSLLISDVF